MKKQLITVGIIFILTVVGLSGCLETSNDSSNALKGTFLYSIDNWSGDLWGKYIDFKGDLVSWIQTKDSDGLKYLYVLDISNINSPQLVKTERIEASYPSGPLVMSEYVIWVDDEFYYYDVSNDETVSFDLDNCALGIDHDLVTSQDDYVKVYDLSDGSKIEIIASAIDVALSENYLIWAEREEYIFDERITYNIWSYNRNTGEKEQILDNITCNYRSGLDLAIENSSVVYSDDFKINMYDVETEQNKVLVEHSRKDSEGLIYGEIYFRNIRLDENYLIYTEVSNEWVGEGVDQIYNYWCEDISSGEKIELETAHRIDNGKIVGIVKNSNTDDKLYVYELDDLFS